MGRISNAKDRLMEAVIALIWSGSYGSTTIEQICKKAGVKIGSFYYFFDSKADLALAAIEAEWNVHRLELDSLFSPTVPPLDRLRNFCDSAYRFQADIKAKYGHVLGCPLFSLGAEVSTQENALQRKVTEILEYKRKYLESTIRDADAAGIVHAPDAAAKSRAVAAYYEGLLTQARIEDNVEILREAEAGIFDILGVKQGVPAHS